MDVCCWCSLDRGFHSISGSAVRRVRHPAEGGAAEVRAALAAEEQRWRCGAGGGFVSLRAALARYGMRLEPRAGED